jgi:hypothetical protein
VKCSVETAARAAWSVCSCETMICAIFAMSASSLSGMTMVRGLAITTSPFAAVGAGS